MKQKLKTSYVISLHYTAHLINLNLNLFQLNHYSVMVNDPFLTVVLGDFNAKTSLWCNNGITTYDVPKIDGVTSQFGLEQIIKESTHIIGDSSSYIDLIFTTQPNLVMES